MPNNGVKMVNNAAQKWHKVSNAIFITPENFYLIYKVLLKEFKEYLKLGGTCTLEVWNLDELAWWAGWLFKQVIFGRGDNLLPNLVYCKLSGSEDWSTYESLALAIVTIVHVRNAKMSAVHRRISKWFCSDVNSWWTDLFQSFGGPFDSNIININWQLIGRY